MVGREPSGMASLRAAGEVLRSISHPKRRAGRGPVYVSRETYTGPRPAHRNSGLRQSFLGAGASALGLAAAPSEQHGAATVLGASSQHADGAAGQVAAAGVEQHGLSPT